jgi:hypothetical protein
MPDVDVTPLLKGHIIPTKEKLLIQIAEEANFCGCSIAIVRSNNYQVCVWGCAGSLLEIKAFCYVKLGWKVTTIQTREATKANDDPAEEVFYYGEEKVTDEDKAIFGGGRCCRKSTGSTPTYSNQFTLDNPFTPE